MRIVVDAMGADAGATPLVRGAMMAVRDFDCEILLVGKQHTLGRLLRHFGYSGRRIQIAAASQVVRMEDNPTESLQRRDSSMAVAARLVREGQGDALVSAGNTGAVLAHALTCWRRLKGVNRPGIAALMPTPKHPCLLLDVGANAECKPRNLLDFAAMGTVYCREVLGRDNPRVGLMSVGTESSKGNTFTLRTYELLKASHLNFVGNVEGGDLFSGDLDVIVCDGFTGNVILKVSEGAARMIMKGLKGAMTRSVISLAGALMVSPGMRRLRKQVDHNEYGGAPLLGLNGICIICHGSSNARAIRNAVRVAIEAVSNRLNEVISLEVRQIEQEIADTQTDMENGGGEGTQLPSEA